MFVLRPYQEDAIDAVMTAMKEDRYILLQAATGAGKTIVFCELIRRVLSEFKMRIAILAHRRELIIQAGQKLKKVWPEASIGLACSGVSSNVDVDAPVVIGSIQTLTNRLGSTAPFHLVIIDEAHRIPPVKKGSKSQYLKFLRQMESYFPQLRVLGVTATPYRLGHGYIYGEKCKPGHRNLFPVLNYKIGIRDLQEQGYLCGIRAKEAENIELELAGIRTSGGDFNLRQLTDVMSKAVHVGSAVKAYQEYGEGRCHVVVFCVTIEHAEKVQDAFREAGFSTGCVHSRLSMRERDRILAEFRDGRIRILTNVGVLTEGWDAPMTDCILFCRPTKSPALYVQMLGRGTRIHPGKEDLLVLDLSGNIHRHGDPDNPTVTIPSRTGGAPPKATKTCPNCKMIVAAATYECPDCGYEWEKPVAEEWHDPVKMREIDLRTAVKTIVIESVEPTYHISRAGNPMLKMMITGTNGDGNMPISLYHFWDVEGNGSFYGRSRARHEWELFGGRKPAPQTIGEALERWGELTLPGTVEVKKDGKYLKITRWRDG